MVFIYITFTALFIVIIYLIYKSYYFQFFYHKYRIKNDFIKSFQEIVKGKYYSDAYFGPSHKIISVHEYKSMSNKHKMNFSKCYNIITFKTPDIKWELYFYLIKDGMSFSEIFNLRAFPKDYKIKSEGNVEKSYSRINIFTNNRYLTKVLEKQIYDDLEWLIRHNGDSLLISYNNLHFKASLKSEKLTKTRTLDMIKAMNNIKSGIYKKDLLEY
ncbi:MAG: hypothetical protein ACOC16_01385 [Nanoarchaeota archaeon]